MKNQNVVALFCGYPPNCDRCTDGEAVARFILPDYGTRQLCNNCIVEIIELGFGKLKNKKDQLISDAAKAEEVYSIDELEEYAGFVARGNKPE